MLQTPDGRKTSLQKDDVIVLERKGRNSPRIVIYRLGRPLLINGKPCFEFPRAKKLPEQFKWMCWFADAVGEASLVEVPPGRVMVAFSSRASLDLWRE